MRARGSGGAALRAGAGYSPDAGAGGSGGAEPLADEARSFVTSSFEPTICLSMKS